MKAIKLVTNISCQLVSLDSADKEDIPFLITEILELGLDHGLNHLNWIKGTRCNTV